HGPEGARDAIATARAAGFDNVSVDLIFGLPGHLERDWGADLRATLHLAPEHVSLYGLTAEPGAPLGRRVREGREALADEDRYAEEYLLAHDLLTEAGYEHYEVSNFGRPGLRSRHNAVYWTGGPYVALGPGAHAFLPPERRWNLRSWTAYRDALRFGALPIEGREVIEDDVAAIERTWLSLRTSDGCPIEGASPRQRDLIERWVVAGLVTLRDGILRATARGWLLLDELTVELERIREVGLPGSKRAPFPAIDAGARLVQISANSNSRS